MAARLVSRFYCSSPVIVILGSTGTGKSKLAIELAKKFNGEIINADAMQMYKGLDIITNKVTSEEQDGIPHHVLGLFSPLKMLNVCEYRDHALCAMNDIIGRKKLPIIVGGTYYYVEALLYDFVLAPPMHYRYGDHECLDKEKGLSEKLEEKEESPQKKMKIRDYMDLQADLEKLDNEKLYERLKIADPELAKQLHPNYRRKIIRSAGMVLPVPIEERKILGSPPDVEHVERRKTKENPNSHLLPGREVELGARTVNQRIYCNGYSRNKRLMSALLVPQQYGESLSSLLEKQRSQPGGCSTGGPLKIPNSLILTIQCESGVLNSRLDARVDDMISRGLVEELLAFHDTYNKENALNDRSPDYTRGIFQSIGFKEFHEFLVLSPESRESENGKKLFEKGVEMLKIATKRYAKHQMRWIVNRLIKNAKRQLPPIYSLDGTDVSKWKENVWEPAEHIVECHLEKRKPSIEPMATTNAKVEIDRTYQCECGKILIGKAQFEVHLKGKNHIREMKRKKRMQMKEMEEEKEKERLTEALAEEAATINE